MQNDQQNPYSNPEPNLPSEDNRTEQTMSTEQFMPDALAVPAGVGVNWITDAWVMFKPFLGKWILTGLVLFIILTLLNYVPVINLLTTLLMPVFTGGIMAICEKQRTQNQFDMALLFYGFQRHFGNLLLIGLIQLVITMIALVALSIFGGGAFIMAAASGNESDIMNLSSSGVIFFGLFLMILIMLFGVALTWFAPALIMIHKVPVLQALSMSLSAVKKNLLAGLLYFIVISIMMVIAMIPFFLGLIITVPLMYISYYTAYRSLFIKSSN